MQLGLIRPIQRRFLPMSPQEAGITGQHFSGESPDRFLIETMGGGVAFLDFDGDGLQDIFFVNGGETPHGKSPLQLMRCTAILETENLKMLPQKQALIV